MIERPILFSGPMVRAILEGKKTQTRRVMKPIKFIPVGKRAEHRSVEALVLRNGELADPRSPAALDDCRYGHSGDRLWVRESFCPDWCDHVLYKADCDGKRAADAGFETEPRFRPSIHMPRRLSRITLEIVKVRVERVQEITPGDAIQEGVIEWTSTLSRDERVKALDGKARGIPYPVNAFAELWDSINGKRGFGWSANPWVWVIEFRRIKP